MKTSMPSSGEHGCVDISSWQKSKVTDSRGKFLYQHNVAQTTFSDTLSQPGFGSYVPHLKLRFHYRCIVAMALLLYIR